MGVGGGAAPATNTTYHTVSTAAVVNANLKPSSGSLYEIQIENYTTTACYVKLYDKATTVVPASDVPILTLYVAPGTATIPTDYAKEFGAIGKHFANGITIGATAAVAATDTTALAAGVQITATYL